VGKRVRYHGVWCTIVGVSSDVRNLNLRAPAHPAIFTPIAQRPIWGPQIVMRTGGSPPTEARIQAALSEVDSRLIVTDVHPMTQLIADTVAADRYRAMLMSLFGMLAAVLSAIGMYGVTARAVARRRREVGIRLALGATRTSVVKQMLRATITGAGLGLVVGVAATLALARLLAPFLFGVAPSDPATYAAIAALLGITAVLAAWLPASRAGRMQVVEVLHAD
jgi:ABC-type antimicrobial peptide transport system permease subunit